jgi:hypothetical protein
MTKRIEERVRELEKYRTSMDSRVLPLDYFYGEPLPQDFYTNPKYKYTKERTLADFYAEVNPKQQEI